MKIIETFIQGKENDPDTCEDGIFIGENIAAVLDGVTAKGTCLWKGKKKRLFWKEPAFEVPGDVPGYRNAGGVFLRP